LYRKDGLYWYAGGYNVIAIVALAAGIAPCVPGFLTAIKVVAAPDIWVELYKYAWFVSFGVAFGIYAVAMKVKK
jgi:NCS1 family nucleobase:cation symporter-1